MKRSILCCLLCAAFAAPAAAQPEPKLGPEVTALVAQAAKEGKLELSWSGGSFGNNGKDLPGWIGAFNKFYGLHLAYSFTPAPSMSQQAAGLVQEAQSNTKAYSDAVILGPDFLLVALKGHATLSRDWAVLAKEIGVALPTQAVAPEGGAVAFSTGVFGIVYNAQAVSAKGAPQTLADTLKPEWKGRIASTPYAAGFSFLAAFDPNWGPTKTDAFVAKLAQQIGGLIRCGDSGPLLSGQFDLMVLECDVSSAVMEKRRGEPIGFVIPKDAPIMDLWYMAVPKGAADPAAGTLLALFMLTKEGQDISWNSDGNDLALLPGSRIKAELPGSTATIATVQDFAAHPEAMNYVAQHIKILNAGGRK